MMPTDLMEKSPNPNQPSNLARNTLAVLVIGILIVACFWVLQPFLSSLIWAAMLVIALWPLFIKLQARLWGKRWLAVTVMIVLLLLLLFVPIILAVVTIAERADEVVAWCKSLPQMKIPAPPEWLGKVPLAGHWLVEHWQKYAAASPEELARLSKSLAPYARQAVGWFAGKAGSFGLLLLHFLLSVAIAGVLFMHGESAAAAVRAFARRLAGQQGEDIAVLSAKAVRGVALGIVVTALVQSALGGIGLFVAGVPAAFLLTAVMLLLCIMQIGPSLILIPAAIWLFWSGEKVTGSLFSVWAILVIMIDNFLRPVLIRRGADLPLLLILVGVLGGLVAFGIIGLFIGPVILAVVFTLLKAWVQEDLAAPAADPNSPGEKSR
jgi:predicted PurR-regulated permease PerM